MDSLIERRAYTAIGNGVFPGCVVGTLCDGVRTVHAFGEIAPGENASADTLFDVASITKSIPTASLALLLEAEGSIKFSDQVSVYLPELRNHFNATIEDLLRYRVTGVRMSDLKDCSYDELIEAVFSAGFDGSPGESRYSNLPAFLLGIIIERVTKTRLDTLASERLFVPLRMGSTTFFPPSASVCAPTEVEGDTEIRGVVHDESARVCTGAGHPAGHAGLFSTTDDLLTFLAALMSDVFPPIRAGAERGLGWQLCDRTFMGEKAGDHTFGKTGFTGTSVLCDVDRSRALVILSNRTYPKRPPTQDAIFAFRRDIANIVLQ